MFVIVNCFLNLCGFIMFFFWFVFKFLLFLIGDVIDDVGVVIVGDGDIDVFMCDILFWFWWFCVKIGKIEKKCVWYLDKCDFLCCIDLSNIVCVK